MTTHNSNDLLSHLTLIQDSGANTISLGFLLGNDNKHLISVEPIITSLQKIDSINVHLKLDDDKTLTLSASDNSIQFSFKLDF